MDYDSLERRYSAWRVLYETGEITDDDFQRHVDSLAGEDPFGRQWRLDWQTGHWLRLEEGRWIAADPRRTPPPASSGEETASPQPSEPEPVRLSLAAWLRANWGWAAVLGAGVVLIAASIFFMATLLLVPQDPPPEVALPTATSGPAPAPVDVDILPTDAPTSPPTPAVTITDQGHEMVLVPAGPFRMGTTQEELDALYALCSTVQGFDCQAQEFESELPARDVNVSTYYIDAYEVTNAQYAGFLTVAGNQTSGGKLWYDALGAGARLFATGDQWQSDPAYANHPVTEVTWYGAEAYCEWRGGRLPTEAEWEKAARFDPASNTARIYPWGNDQPNAALANFGVNVGGTREVGSYEAGQSALGLYDMAGNAFEWVLDWFTPNYEDADTENPRGPDESEYRVIRGGSWGDNPFLLRTANRGFILPTAALNFVGFRCHKDPAAITP